jgi:uncharacterized protein with HEPN domain
VSFSQIQRDEEFARTISEASEYVRTYIESLDLEEFLNDRKTQDAVSMRLQQILECASKLSERTRNSLDVDWASLKAMRNKMSHHYIDVDPNIVWQVINDFEEYVKLIEWAIRTSQQIKR